MMAPLSPRSASELKRSDLKAEFAKWYYADGNALFLGFGTQDAYLRATELLEADSKNVPDALVRKAFSNLRTQMKIDLGVYTTAESSLVVGGSRDSSEG